jgi:DNA ligase-1
MWKVMISSFLKRNDQLIDIAKTQDRKVDHLLQIVDGGMSREYSLRPKI